MCWTGCPIPFTVHHSSTDMFSSFTVYHGSIDMFFPLSVDFFYSSVVKNFPRNLISASVLWVSDRIVSKLSVRYLKELARSPSSAYKSDIHARGVFQ
jgi:hypothetical protein